MPSFKEYCYLDTFILQLQDVMSEGELEEEYKKKIDLISERMVALTTYQNHVDQISTNYEMMLMTGLDRKIQLCEIELGSGGNVKFTSSGGPTGDQWYRACVELVKSRFSPSNWLVGVASGCGFIIIIFFVRSLVFLELKFVMF